MKSMLKLIVIVILGLSLISCGTKATSLDDEKVATPSFSTGGGTFDTAVNVLISCTTPGAVIRYTLDNSEPNSNSTIYTEVLHIAANTTLKARAYKSGWIASSTISAIYQFTASAAPELSPPGGTYTANQMVSITCATPNAQIRYTLDGSEPSQASALYLNPIVVSQALTIKAIAYVPGISPSPVTTEVYNMQAIDPVFDPAGGSYSIAQVVNISTLTDNASIYYTLDGTEPTETSILFTHPINVAANTIVKAKAFRNGWNPSNTVITAYGINVPDQMVYVNGGTFHNGFSNVSLSPFYIGKYEVNQFDWVMIMGTAPFFYPDVEDAPPVPDLPAENISWYNAIEYCNRRSMSEGYNPCYSYIGFGTDPSAWPAGWDTDPNSHLSIACNWNANGYRLPTEMEWMFAARGGNFTQNYLYSGSNNIDDVAWYTNNSNEETAMVGLKQPNELGIYDMSGNVWEYCWDIFAPLPTTDQVSPTGAVTGISRAIRGGSCLQDASNCTIARRFPLLPMLPQGTPSIPNENNIIGFRMVRKAF